MKVSFLISASAAIAIALLTPSKAEASCQSICQAGYRACIASGDSEELCVAERNACVEACGARTFTPLSHASGITDRNGKPIFFRAKPLLTEPLEKPVSQS